MTDRLRNLVGGRRDSGRGEGDEVLSGSPECFGAGQKVFGAGSWRWDKDRRVRGG